MDSTLVTLQQALESRSLRGLTDAEFVAVTARLVDPNIQQDELAEKYRLSVRDVGGADEFLFDPAGMLEDHRTIFELDQIRQAEREKEQEDTESFQDWLENEFNKRWFAFQYRVPTTQQASQIESASGGDRQFVEDILDIAEQKVMHGYLVRSPVGFTLTVLKQPKEKVRAEAQEARRNGKRRPTTVDREPRFDDDDHPAA